MAKTAAILQGVPPGGKANDSRYRPRSRTIRLSVSRTSSMIIMLVAAVVLAGWLFDIQIVKSLSPSWATMKVNTALSFLLCGFALWNLSDDRDTAPVRLPGMIAVAIVMAIGGLTISEYSLGVDLGIDEFLMKQAINPAELAAPGRMSAATAICFITLGGALFCQSSGKILGRSASLLLAWTLAAVSLIAVVGYVYGVETLYPVWPFSSMALHTATLFGVAAFGILGGQSDRSPLGVLALEGSGSAIARRSLPFAVLVPVLIGWLTLRGAEAGLYGLEFGLGLVVTSIILAFVLMIWIIATVLNTAEAISREAAAKTAAGAIRRRILFEQARDGILIMDAEWKIHEANASFADLLGYAPAEMPELQPWQWSVRLPTRELFLEEWPEIPSASGQLDTQLRRKNGDFVHAEISYTPAELDGSKYLFCVIRDVSVRKSTELALRESQQRFQRALANIPDVIVIYDRDLRIRHINDATRSVTGMSAADFIGRRDDEIFPPEVYKVYLPTLEDAFASKLIRKIDTELTLPGGGQRSLRITCVPLMDDRGEVREILGITHDYTDRKNAEEKIRQSEARYRELIEQAADGIFISDADGNFTLANTRCSELLGYSHDELLGMNGRETYLDEETDATTRRLKQLSTGHDLRYERMLRRKDGKTFPAEVSVKMLESGSMQVIFHDITTRHMQERKIDRLSRIHAVLSGINSAIVRIRNRRDLFREACRIAVEAGKFGIAWIGKLDTDSGRIRMVAQSGLSIELDEQEASAGPLVELVADGPARFSLKEKRPVYDNDIEHSLHMSKLRRTAIQHGAKSVISLPLNVEGTIFGLMVLYAPERNFFDDEELKLLKELAGDISFALDFIANEEKVDYLAFYDTLTDLPNRNLFFDAFKRQLRSAERDGRKVLLQLLDIDRFRMINETYGRDGADRLIRAIANRLTTATGEGDTVARVGPDSFAVAMSGVWQAAQTAHGLEELHERVFGQPFVLNDEELRVSATSGVVVFPGDGKDEHSLLSNAEAAQRNAEKQNIPYLFYSPKMNERVADSIRLENRLRLALERDEFLMWYQPKLDVSTHELTGFEALMRWQDGDSGEMIRPAEFIPVLEQTGLIHDAGRLALSKVVLDCANWASANVAVPRVAINVSPMQLREDNFVSSITEMHAQIIAHGSLLEIELTESVIMENIESIVPKLNLLRDLGITISVDDFGTGYSSLAYISRLPIHSLKIDRSFVFGMMQDENAMVIVKSVISLASSLGLKVVAEGVETLEQAEMLAELKCDEMQGYYLSHPVAPAEVPALIDSLN